MKNVFDLRGELIAIKRAFTRLQYCGSYVHKTNEYELHFLHMTAAQFYEVTGMIEKWKEDEKNDCLS